MISKTGITLERAIAEYIQGRADRQEIMEATVAIFKECLALMSEHLGRSRLLRSVERADILGWVGQMGLRLRPSTMRLRISTARTFFEWCLLSGHIKRDPMVGVRGPKKPRTIPRRIQETDVRLAVANATDARERLMIILMVQEGLRAMEVAGLEMADIDRHVGVMTVHGKGGHDRTLPICEETLEVLDAYLKERGLASGYLIQSYQRSYANKTGGLSRKYVARIVCQSLHRSGIEESGHALRHTMAHTMIDEGADIRDVQTVLGHASMMTTQIYLPLTEVTKMREYMGKRRYVDQLESDQLESDDQVA